MSRDPGYEQDYRDRTNQDAVERVKVLEAVLREVEAIRPMWEGGVRGSSAAALEGALQHIRAIARAALNAT